MTGPAFTFAVAEAGAFAATVPFPSGGAVMRIARAGLACVLIPLLTISASGSTASELETAIRGGTAGVAFGLTASIAFSAAGAAGGLINAALAWSPLPDRDAAGGELGFVYQLAFVTILLGSGGLSAMVFTLAKASGALPHVLFTVGGIAGLARLATRDALVLAAPALFAQVIATLFAGVAARAAPQIGGLLMTSPLVSVSVGVALLAGAGSLFERFGWIVKASLANLAPH